MSPDDADSLTLRRRPPPAQPGPPGSPSRIVADNISAGGTVSPTHPAGPVLQVWMHWSLPPAGSTANTHTMLVKTSYRDVPTKAKWRSGTMRIYITSPTCPTTAGKVPRLCRLFRDLSGHWPCREVGLGVQRHRKHRVLMISGFAANIASEGYIVALPSSFHEFEGPERFRTTPREPTEATSTRRVLRLPNGRFSC